MSPELASVVMGCPVAVLSAFNQAVIWPGDVVRGVENIPGARESEV